MNEAFIGSIVLFAGNFAPKGWALCQGQVMGIAQNSALFSILGTTYGGNGTTTFNLPDLRGTAALSQGQMPGGNTYTLGEKAGSETVTLNMSQMPAHTHPVQVNAQLQVSSAAPSSDEAADSFLTNTATPSMLAAKRVMAAWAA